VETLLLPGLDGTGTLLAPFARRLEPALAPRIVSFPSDVPLGYDELLERIDIPAGRFAIVAESFSGPLGIRLANRCRDRVRGLVLVATFVRSPSALAALSSALGPLLFRLRPPALALRWGLLGADAPADDVNAFRSALACVQPRVLARRLRAVADVDATEDLASCVTPLLYLAGASDRLVGARVRERLQRIRPDLETRVLDAPHLVLQRRPAEAAQLIGTFLAAQV
jgi:pimeloyl-ACP methyl ester carboxylesterase